MAIACLMLIGISTPLHAALKYNLLWYQNGSPIDEVTLQINESVTFQLLDEYPALEFYDLEIGNSFSPVAEITSVSPLFGNVSYSQPLAPDYWLLHYEWDWNGALPISDWVPHWEVTITGLTPGDHSFYSGGVEDYSILNVNVVPIPSSILLLFSGLLFIRFKRKHNNQS